jgi:hypothetical protein
MLSGFDFDLWDSCGLLIFLILLMLSLTTLIIGVEVLFLYLFKNSFLIVQKQLFPEEA